MAGRWMVELGIWETTLLTERQLQYIPLTALQIDSWKNGLDSAAIEWSLMVWFCTGDYYSILLIHAGTHCMHKVAQVLYKRNHTQTDKYWHASLQYMHTHAHTRILKKSLTHAKLKNTHTHFYNHTQSHHTHSNTYVGQGAHTHSYTNTHCHKQCAHTLHTSHSAQFSLLMFIWNIYMHSPLQLLGGGRG